MPYILSSTISPELPGMWLEGKPYEKRNLYAIKKGELPPVNYDAHIIKSHSLTHMEAAAHTIKDGKNVEDYFTSPHYFYGKAIVLRLEGNFYKPILNGKEKVFHWEVTLRQLKESLSRLTKDCNAIEKLILTTQYYPTNNFGYHDPNYVLTLSEEAAEWLVSMKNFNMYGTSWKSSDFKPGSVLRPIHKILFQKAAIFECLDLRTVPEGTYFFVGLPLRIEKASESPVCPILFTKDEIHQIF